MAPSVDETTPLISEEQVQIRNRWLYLAVFSAVLGNFNLGYAMVYPSPVIPQLSTSNDPRLKMDTHQTSWFGSIFSLGAALGGLSAMLLIDRVGRKLSIMMSAVPSAVGLLVMGAAQEVWMLLLGRFLTGIAGGITVSSIPVYVSEISHPSVRGALGSCPQITSVFGSLALYVLGLVLPWRWLAVVGEVPVVVMLVLLCFMPSSPRYLITHEKKEEAHQALKWLRGPNSDYLNELNQIEHSIQSQVGFQWHELRNPFYYKPILISIFLGFFQQITGVSPILVYLEPIFQKMAISLDPKYSAALVGLVRLFSVSIAASLMDKAGRKALLFTSGFLMYLSMLSITMYTHKTPCLTVNLTSVPVDFLKGAYGASVFDPITLIPLISTMVIIFGYAVGWGPIAWLMMSEILPLGARGVVSGLSVVVSCITSFALTQLFMQVVVDYGLYVPFLFFCIVCVVAIIFTAKCVPETKGRTLEEIENYFRTGRSFTINEA
ncbi:solute carrier family 2, facilitated glucose transporter member 6-like [Myxocyprinus asiaticus]|uniref:solute carrier family 2, facilitated glucose transporter member 6-like n=1 Tax=Myxocyprinus asiaticus TaxID=70543 RepID=UPI0022236233|nr:solute carrier family 2, facilitated glucose transporter member 6-like [Myxocyprinus asiaticus]XP_051525028.1 solute carrier family 2, facilitated glucose transporter member 6-like [Myxocyprinus asiaticus]XP_051525029.1 solute carrier family 2, facilitated glucose transporter member 6-like [Myxocyprinus asiaticus]